jgi:hypothetical protein
MRKGKTTLRTKHQFQGDYCGPMLNDLLWLKLADERIKWLKEQGIMELEYFCDLNTHLRMIFYCKSQWIHHSLNPSGM